MTAELVDALAARIKSRIGAVTMSGLVARADLNGHRATIVGPLDGGRLPVRIAASGEGVCVRVSSAHGGCDELPVCLEVGAGSGALSHRLVQRLAGWARVMATDSGHDKIPTAGSFCVERLDVDVAIEKFKPAVVLVSWHPSGLDWIRAMRASASVQEYILLGEADSSTCGDGWATWGVLPPRFDE
mmetsp:Transcript_44284/g.109644  ORF Transcript_44284/g.109644 Transcript_44284/m.109644 type:complete len:186 (+) Transcript_44284:347-904(+)